MTCLPHVSCAAAVCLAWFLPTASVAGGNCQGTSTGSVPLIDLGAGKYQGFEGGLYPGGSNVRPSAHEAAGLLRAAQVVPRDAAGRPDPNGKIVILTIGMSNTSMETDWFAFFSHSDVQRNPAVLVVNGAHGGLSAQGIFLRGKLPLSFIDSQIALAGVTPEQVQVVWYKLADEAPQQPFPQHALALEAENIWIMQELRRTYPNLELAYVSTRIYGGYATADASPEPIAYETGFAYKWMIEQQVLGDPSLNYDPARGAVMAPWLSWGPYLWADGLTPRSDGLTWDCSDFQDDGMHPSFLGAVTVGGHLHSFFRKDATTVPWYVGGAPLLSTSAPIPRVSAWSAGAPRPNPFGARLSIPLSLSEAAPVTATVFSLAGRRVRVLRDGTLGSGLHELVWDGRDESGRRVVAGTYLVRIEGAGEARTVKATLVR
ncbi:MAG: FlgD immunoglobulin-like domain containing protein [Candidatus Eiseniibacteriota bacterium]